MMRLITLFLEYSNIGSRQIVVVALVLAAINLGFALGLAWDQGFDWNLEVRLTASSR